MPRWRQSHTRWIPRGPQRFGPGFPRQANQSRPSGNWNRPATTPSTVRSSESCRSDTQASSVLARAGRHTLPRQQQARRRHRSRTRGLWGLGAHSPSGGQERYQECTKHMNLAHLHRVCSIPVLVVVQRKDARPVPTPEQRELPRYDPQRRGPMEGPAIFGDPVAANAGSRVESFRL
jgi:hypothetical protein